MKLFKPPILLTIISITITWIVTTLVVLVYSFTYLDEFNDQLVFFLDHKLVILILTVIAGIITILITGVLIDRNPTDYLHKLFIVSLLGTILFLFILGIMDGLIIIGLSFIGLGASLGILGGVSGSYFAGFASLVDRGKIYSLGVLVFSGISVSILFFQTLLEIRNEKVIFLVLGGLAILTLLFSLALFPQVPVWTNDKWPTSVKRILDRGTLRNYLMSHFLIYFMIGLAINAITEAGKEIQDIGKIWRELGILSESFIDPVILFWITVLLAIFLSVFPAGYLIDRIGTRKNPLIISIYIVATCLFIFDIEQSSRTYLYAAFILGGAIAIIHVTIDSSIWSDLAPRDAIGRYFALGFSTLILGISLGYGLGVVIVFYEIKIAGLLLIFLATLSIFPLFYVNDSFEPLDFKLLLLIFEGGRPCYWYTFGEKEQSFDMALLASALDAIGTFMHEIMGDEKGELNQVRHGNYFIISEIAGPIKGALLTNKSDKEVKDRLKVFLHRFVSHYNDQLENWFGELEVFKNTNTDQIVEEEFGPLIPSQS